MSPVRLSQVCSFAISPGLSRQASGASCNAIWWASSFQDLDGNRMQTFMLDFPDGKGFVRKDYCSMEGSLGGYVFGTGKPWIGNASDVLQLGLNDEPAIGAEHPRRRSSPR